MYGEPMESWMNILDINVRRQSDGACQEIVSHKYKRYEVRRRRNVPKCFSETHQKLRVLLLKDNAGDATNTGSTTLPYTTSRGQRR
jgi:hypothetical protein